MFNDEEHDANTVIAEEKKQKVDKKEPKIKKERKPLFPKPQNMGIFIILILLILQVLMLGYQTTRDIIHDVQRSQMIASVTKYTANADQLTTQLLTDYKTDVYNNANVNSTEKQLVMGTEYNFMAMMLLAKQNSRLLELLSQIE